MTIATTLLIALIATMFVSTTSFAMLNALREGRGKPQPVFPTF